MKRLKEVDEQPSTSVDDGGGKAILHLYAQNRGIIISLGSAHTN